MLEKTGSEPPQDFVSPLWKFLLHVCLVTCYFFFFLVLLFYVILSFFTFFSFSCFPFFSFCFVFVLFFFVFASLHYFNFPLFSFPIFFPVQMCIFLSLDLVSYHRPSSFIWAWDQQDFSDLNQGRSQDFSKGGSHCVKVRVFTRLSLWPRYRQGIFATCCRLFG